MARRDIRDVTPLGIKAINDNFIDLSYKVFGTASFAEKVDKQVKKNTASLTAITTSVGDLEGSYGELVVDVNSVSLAVYGDIETAGLVSKVEVLEGEITSKVTASYVDDAVTSVNQRGLNFVSNLAANWFQDDAETISTINNYKMPSSSKLTVHSGTGFQCEYTIYFYGWSDNFLGSYLGQLNNINYAETVTSPTGSEKFQISLSSPEGVALTDLRDIMLKIEQGEAATSYSAYPPDEGIDLTEVYNRIESAESKITPTAITNAVETKINVDGSTVLATKGDLTLTNNSLTAKFTQSGAMNYVKNGNLDGGISGYTYYHITDSSPYSILARSYEWTGYENALELIKSNSGGTLTVLTFINGLTPGRKYTVGCLMAGHRANNRLDVVNGADSSLIASSNTISNGYGGANITDWGIAKVTFTATDATMRLRFVCDAIADSAFLWAKKIRCNEGELLLPYLQNGNESYSTTHVLNSEGYSMKDSKGDMLLTPNGVANEQNIVFADNVENGYPMRIPFHIGSEVSQIVQVKFKWRNYPFRTYSKGAASGGGSTSGASSRSTTDAIWSGSSIAESTSAVTAGSLPHQHTILKSKLSHGHGMAHTHSTPNHAHNPVFGILEESLYSTMYSIDVYIDGAHRTTVNAIQGEVDLSAWLTTSGWHEVELRSDYLKRISATLFMKTYIRR